MSRRRPHDSIAWTAYRRSWAVPVIALLILLATSFRAEAPVQATLPPTLQNEQATELLAEAGAFAKQFPDRRPGSSGAVDSAQWMRDRFEALDLTAETVLATTTSPATNRTVGLHNVEAKLPGRTRELVVILAHRDTADASGRGGDAVGQMALLALAKELSATQDRRRTYMFVSTDAGTLNGGGARALAQRLTKRGGVVAVIALDRVGVNGTLRVDAAPSETFAPPLGLVQVARDAVGDEGGARRPSSVLSQVAQLAVPITLREHGQLLGRGLPAVTITRGDDQLRTSGDRVAQQTEGDVGAGLRSVQRFIATLDQMDQVQTAGKTWIASERRVYRGWALKIFVASLLIPVWVVLIDLVVRRRRTWNTFALIGTGSRAALAGIWAVGALWVLSTVGLLASSGDRPPNPMAFTDGRWLGLLLWAVLVAVGWLVARGPDWRRTSAVGPTDDGDIVLSMVLLVMISAMGLAINPFTVLFAIPTLHAWLILTAQPARSLRARAGAWAVGMTGPLVAMLTLSARSDVGVGSPVYMLQLIQTRTVPPVLGLLAGAATGLALLVLLGALGRVGHPALPHVRRVLVDLHLDGAMVRRVLATLRRGATSTFRVPKHLRPSERRSGGPRRPSTTPRRAPKLPAATTPAERAAARMAQRAERGRSRVKRR